jgi:hypothetical protein
MFVIGAGAIGLITGWDRMPRRKQFFIVAWLVFWLGPPLYFIWTKGVLG